VRLSFAKSSSRSSPLRCNARRSFTVAERVDMRYICKYLTRVSILSTHRRREHKLRSRAAPRPRTSSSFPTRVVQKRSMIGKRARQKGKRFGKVEDCSLLGKHGGDMERIRGRRPGEEGNDEKSATPDPRLQTRGKVLLVHPPLTKSVSPRSPKWDISGLSASQSSTDCERRGRSNGCER
jgi:hypothetical protein